MEVDTKHLMSFVTGRTLVKMNQQDLYKIAGIIEGSWNDNVQSDWSGSSVAIMAVQTIRDKFINDNPEFLKDIRMWKQISKTGVSDETIETFIEYAVTKYGETYLISPTIN